MHGMKDRLVVWGDIGTDRKALIAIELLADANEVVFRAFPEEDVDLDLQTQLFTTWKNGGEFEFPENLPMWTVNAAQEHLVPAEIRLHKPELLVEAQNLWSRKVIYEMHTKLLSDKLHLLELEMESIQHYDKNLWDRTRALWDEIVEHRKKNNITWLNAEDLKPRVNVIFEALKAFRRLDSEKNFEGSQALFNAFGKRLEEFVARLVYPDEWNRIFNALKTLHGEVREAPLLMKHRRKLDKLIDNAFTELRKYRQADQIGHLQKRVADLNRILAGLREGIERDRESYELQFEKLRHYTRGKLTDAEIAEQLGPVRSRSRDKEKKITQIENTLKSLEEQIARVEAEPAEKPPRGDKAKRKRNRKKREGKPAEAEKAGNANAESPQASPAAEAEKSAPESPGEDVPAESAEPKNTESETPEPVGEGSPEESAEPAPAEGEATTETTVPGNTTETVAEPENTGTSAEESPETGGEEPPAAEAGEEGETRNA